MRVFVAIDVEGGEIVEKLRSAQEWIHSTGADLKLVEPENLHFTIKFLGEVPDAVVTAVEGKLSSLSFKSFGIKYRGLGVFPNPNRISVVWVGTDMDGGGRMKEVADSVDSVLGPIAPGDKGRFTPHATIARVKSGKAKDRLLDEIKKREDTFFGEEIVKSLKLKKSVLTPSGPVYTDLAVFRFEE